MWSSDLAMKALNYRPSGLPAFQGPEESCSHCGKPITEGVPYSPFKAGDFFSDTRALASASGIVCEGCFVLRQKKAMNNLGYTVITEHGLFSIAKDINKAWLFLTPPEPPFIATLTSATMQHLVWRTPVSLSKELFYLRRGSDLFTIRPAALKRAIAVAEKVRALREEESGNAEPLSPYAAYDRGLGITAHGTLSPKARRHMGNDDLKAFFDLTPGEIWAIGFLLVKNPPVPTQPEPYFIDFRKE